MNLSKAIFLLSDCVSVGLTYTFSLLFHRMGAVTRTYSTERFPCSEGFSLDPLQGFAIASMYLAGSS